MRRKLPEGLILKLNFEEQVSARLSVEKTKCFQYKSRKKHDVFVKLEGLQRE